MLTDGKVDKLREAAEGQSCVRCGVANGTVVLCHYFGARRQAYGGGLGRKGHDLIAAHLCHDCHKFLDTEAKELGGKESRWLHSEEFLNYCALTIIRLWKQGVIS